jgi:Eukaryotic initiation factor 4E
MEPTYPLHRKWKIWEMWNQNKQSSLNFMENMQEIGEFDTIFTFWQHWNYFPHANPEQLFENPDTKLKVIVEGLNQSIEAIGIFENNIKPAWEDTVNINGSDICVRKACTDFKKLKEIWDALVFSVIGESIPHSEDIAGCRIVDKKKNYKFELWLKFDISQGQSEKGEEIKARFASVVGVHPSALSISSHKEHGVQ